MEKIKLEKKWKRLLFPLLILVMMFLPVVSVLAESISGDAVVVESGKSLEKTSFLTGELVRVDGDINGTTFITGGNVEINGNIDGDLFVASQDLIINGRVTGSVFLAGQYMTLNGLVENNIYGAGQGFKIQSQTNGNIFTVGQIVSIEEAAIIERDVFIGAGRIEHMGQVNGDFKSSSDSLTIGGQIAGDLNYSSQEQAVILDGSEITGETNWEKIEGASQEEAQAFFSTAFFLRILWSIVAALLVWLIAQWVRPNFWPQIADQIQWNPLKVFGFGVLGLIVIPMLSILLMVTIIGIPLALIMLSLYGISLYSSKIILAVFLSRFLQNRLNQSTIPVFLLFMLALILLTGLGAIPIVGMVSRFLTLSFGFGAIGFTLVDRKPAGLKAKDQEAS